MQRHKQVSDQGAVAIIAVIFVLVMMILLAFVVDRGLVYAQRAQLQNAVDSAALAAAQEFVCNEVHESTARQVALDYSGFNDVDSADPLNTVVVTVSEGASANYINVQASRPRALVFGPFARTDSVGVAAQATAKVPCNSGYAVFAGNLGFGDSGGMTLTGSIYSDGSLKITSNANSIVDGSLDYVTDCQGCDKASLPDGTTTPTNNVASKTPRCYAYEIGLDRPSPNTTGCTGDDNRAGVIQALPVTDEANCSVVDNAWVSAHTGLVNCTTAGQEVKISATNFDGSGLKGIKTTGQITLDAPDLTIGTKTQPVVLYSEATDRGVEIKGSNRLMMYGYLYAPAGQVYVGGSARLSWFGSVIAQDVTINGTGSGGGTVGFEALYSEVRLIQ